MGNILQCLLFKNPQKDLFNYKTKKNEEFPLFSDDSTHPLVIRNSLQNQADKVGIKAFILHKVLGRGSFGKVLLVEKKDTKILYAMKILNKSYIEEKNQKVHTKAERYILENMDSPFIVQLHYAFQTSDKLYLVMDFVQGGELFLHLRRSAPFPRERALLYAAELVLAIEYLHKKGIIYRDLKPENILIGKDGHLKISDFGLSKYNIVNNEKTYTMCGTPEYLAPEILRGEGHTKCIDWWSLGAVIYEMYTGSPPHYSRDKVQMCRNILNKPIEMKEDFSKELVSLLKGLLCIKPEKRLGFSERDSHEIKAHPFFNSIDWNKLANKEIRPTFFPNLKNDLDLKYFDKLFTSEKPIDTPINYELNFHEDYSNFTYDQINQSSDESLTKSKEL